MGLSERPEREEEGFEAWLVAVRTMEGVTAGRGGKRRQSAAT